MGHADPLVERIAARQDAAQRRADRLRGLLPVLADKLRARGASRIVLFGSLATGSLLHADSDIDLAVSGLSMNAFADCTLELEAITHCRVDLVALERTPPRLLSNITRDGKAL